jgi:AcrR family transcriptional regulator
VAVAAATRRVGAQTSQTRAKLLDCVERLMLTDGYAAVSYRTLAARADVRPSLVQYYFPTLDDLFVAAIRRYSERNRRWLAKQLADRPDDPLHALWESSWGEGTGALMTEFMALDNHRKSIRSEIAAVTEDIRAAQLQALEARFAARSALAGELGLDALVLLISAIPKFLQMEQSPGVNSAHHALISACERYLDTIEKRDG